MPISRKQQRVLFAAKRHLGLNDAEFAMVLARVGDLASITELEQGRFDAVVAFFQHMGFNSVPAGESWGDRRPGMASSRQVQYIRVLWHEYTNGRAGRIPDLLIKLEAAIGVEATRAFLIEYGGRKTHIAKTAEPPTPAHAWLRAEIGHGDLIVPIGPVGRAARLRWSIFRRSAAGHSNREIAAQTYGWLGQFPELREWLGGERIAKGLQAQRHTIVNTKFESTISVERTKFEDDAYGIYGPLFQKMGETARRYPDTLIYPLLAGGFTTLCYDGQNFFDEDHPHGATYDAAGAYTGVAGSVSNLNDALQGDPAWYLMQTKGAFKPIIWQERTPYEFTAVNRPDDHDVFMTDEYKYGIRARSASASGSSPTP